MLTLRHQRFVAEYLIDLNATAAYRRAGYTATGNTAEVNAMRLRKKLQPEIVAAEARRAQLTEAERSVLFATVRKAYSTYKRRPWRPGFCPICQQQYARRIWDHCHTTGRFRDFLCCRCNNGLGQFQDDPERMRRAAAYIEEHRARHASGVLPWERAEAK